MRPTLHAELKLASLLLDSERRLLTLTFGCLAVATTCAAQTPSWMHIKPTISPPARHGHCLAYDAARQRVVLFGGWGRASAFRDTWEWNGANWKQRKPATSPPPGYSSMAYDSIRQRTVLVTRSTPVEVWEWDGTNWQHMKPATKPPNFLDVTYDSSRGRTVGYDNRGATWEWGGANWTNASPARSPEVLVGFGITYDSSRRRTVMFGGMQPLCPSQCLSDRTWEWDGVNWTLAAPKTAPTPVVGHSIVYDSSRQRSVVFGGITVRPSFFDLWEWDGTNWSGIRSKNPPPWRSSFPMAYDSARQRIVLFGGASPGNNTPLSDTWEYGSVNLTLAANTPSISIATGGTQTLTLSAGLSLRTSPFGSSVRRPRPCRESS